MQADLVQTPQGAQGLGSNVVLLLDPCSGSWPEWKSPGESLLKQAGLDAISDSQPLPLFSGYGDAWGLFYSLWLIPLGTVPEK